MAHVNYERARDRARKMRDNRALETKCQRPICRKPVDGRPCNRRQGHEGACLPAPDHQPLHFG